MRSLILTLFIAATGCAQVKYADGQRVAIEHDAGKEWDEVVQKEADSACLKSGGKVPAVRLSAMPTTSIGPAWMSKHVSTFRCA